MKMNIWNPWHGCNKYSEGCDHCYMYYLDAQRDQDGSSIYKTKTNFNLPLKKTRQGIYKIPYGTMLHVCMTSDFFLEEADVWRDGFRPKELGESSSVFRSIGMMAGRM